jgi:hypothetical protein
MDTRFYIHTHEYIYICVCVCVCVKVYGISDISYKIKESEQSNIQIHPIY